MEQIRTFLVINSSFSPAINTIKGRNLDKEGGGGGRKKGQMIKEEQFLTWTIIIYKDATLAMISLRLKFNHSSKEMDPSPFSSIFLKISVLSSVDWKGVSIPNLNTQEILDAVSTTKDETFLATWKPLLP